MCKFVVGVDRVVVASQQQAGTGLSSSRARPDWLIGTAAFAVVLVNMNEVGIAVALRVVRCGGTRLIDTDNERKDTDKRE